MTAPAPVVTHTKVVIVPPACHLCSSCNDTNSSASSDDRTLVGNQPPPPGIKPNTAKHTKKEDPYTTMGRVSGTWEVPYRILQKFHDPRLPLGLPFVAFLFVIRLFQFALALAACAIYGVPVGNASRRHFYIDPRWVFVVVVAGISSGYSAFCLVAPILKPWWFYILDTVLALAWMVVFAIFGKLYIPEDAEGNARIKQMKDMVWLDLTCFLLWSFTAVVGLWFVFWRRRSGGRAVGAAASSLEPGAPVSEVSRSE